ncbi:MAG TPA: glycosyltransferase family 39 protein [Myxococcota bacterium]|nr:glycosyltransferase family 39 protein [Myxococcota bacterium]
MDGIGGATFGLALLATAVAWWAGSRRRTRLALLALLLAALALRVNLAAHWYLGKWDERYHAVVARHLMDHPLEPTLFEHPLHEVPPEQWLESRVWLTHPTLAMQLMALSMSAFGVDEFAMRVPSLVVSTLSVLLTFLLGRRLLGPSGGLVAAGFHAWHESAALWAGGLRSADHVDTLMAFLVELGVLAALWAADDHEPPRPSRWGKAALVGAISGLAFLTKEGGAFVTPAVFFFALLARGGPARNLQRWISLVALPALACAVGVLVVLPWYLHLAHAFPAEFAWLRGRSLHYFLEPVDKHAGSWTWYFGNLTYDYGLLAPIPLVAFVVHGFSQRRDWLPVVGWFFLTYGIYTLAATKMRGYVFPAAPVVFLSYGFFVPRCFALSPGASRMRRIAGATLGVAIVAVFVQGATPRPWATPVRDPLWTQELRDLGSQVAALPPGRWVVFNVGRPIEAMFYAQATCSPTLPDAAALEDTLAKGFRVAVYADADDSILGPLHSDPRVTLLRRYPGSRAARRLADRLLALPSHRLALYNAREGALLADYLESFGLSVHVESRLPRSGAELERNREEGRTPVVLLPPGVEPPSIPTERGDAVFVVDPKYALPLR